MATGSSSLPVGPEPLPALGAPRAAALHAWESLPILGVLLLVVGPLLAFALLVGSGPEPAGSLPAAVAALRGSWEGVGPGDAPSRIEVEAVHPASLFHLWRWLLVFDQYLAPQL